MTFEQLGLTEPLMKAVTALGFTQPTPIQEQTIPAVLQGDCDLVGLAQTGTGKTAAFGLPLLQLVTTDVKYPQALIICPTRELCMQIVKDLEQFSKFMPQMRSVAVYGGAAIYNQIKDLKTGAQIVVATPGRLIDLIERQAINLESINYIVLDEADEMLNMGFKEDIEFVLKHTPNRHCMWLFSATMPPEVKQVSRQFMKTPIEITIGKVNTANINIDHQFYLVSSQDRYEALKRLIDFHPGMYALIFARTRADVQEITSKLVREGYDVDAIHGDLSQAQRDKVMGEFKDKTLQLLIATDVAARGIDVQGITHVINYELPDDPEVYTHRSGRTGRAGKTGVCMSICSPKDRNKLLNIERFIKITFHKLEIPSGKDVCRKQFFHFMDRMLQTDISHGDYETYVPMLEEKVAHMSKVEILKRLAAMEFDRFLKYYENAADLNLRSEPRTNKDRKQSPRGEGRDTRDTKGRSFSGGATYVTLFLNIGQKDGFYKASLLQFILDMSGLKKDVLGRIDLRSIHTTIEIEKEYANQMVRSIDGRTYKGRKMRMNQMR
ncbi:MAG TPA: DEAD/DEAH box helicase [Chitinophagales bacterium]|nr:DEAD/DEAH box helicase [Chitinophagales bacterium]